MDRVPRKLSKQLTLILLLAVCIHLVPAHSDGISLRCRKIQLAILGGLVVGGIAAGIYGTRPAHSSAVTHSPVPDDRDWLRSPFTDVKLDRKNLAAWKNYSQRELESNAGKPGKDVSHYAGGTDLVPDFYHELFRHLVEKERETAKDIISVSINHYRKNKKFTLAKLREAFDAADSELTSAELTATTLNRFATAYLEMKIAEMMERLAYSLTELESIAFELDAENPLPSLAENELAKRLAMGPKLITELKTLLRRAETSDAMKIIDRYSHFLTPETSRLYSELLKVDGMIRQVIARAAEFNRTDLIREKLSQLRAKGTNALPDVQDQ